MDVWAFSGTAPVRFDGSKWKRQGFALPNDVNAIAGFGDDVWGVDGLGIVYHRDDRWDPVAALADASSNLYYIARSAPADIWVGSAGSAAGTVFHFKDGRWTRATVCPRGMGDPCWLVIPSERGRCYVNCGGLDRTLSTSVSGPSLNLDSTSNFKYPRSPRSQARYTTDFRICHRVSFRDALIVRSPRAAGFSVVFSEDMRHGQSYDGW